VGALAAAAFDGGAEAVGTEPGGTEPAGLGFVDGVAAVEAAGEAPFVAEPCCVEPIGAVEAIGAVEPIGGVASLPAGRTGLAGRFQPGGGTTCTKLPHFGHSRIWPMTASSKTFSRARQVVH
jgi:hypothetical protein